MTAQLTQLAVSTKYLMHKNLSICIRADVSMCAQGHMWLGVKLIWVLNGLKIWVLKKELKLAVTKHKMYGYVCLYMHIYLYI